MAKRLSNVKRYNELPDSPSRIEQLREELGLKKIKTGKRNCLRCDRSFRSADLSKIYMCDTCRSYTDGLLGPDTVLP